MHLVRAIMIDEMPHDPPRHAGVPAAGRVAQVDQQRKRALPRDPVPEHRLVYDAIAAADGDTASQRMKTLVQNALDDTWFGMGGTIR